MKPIDQLRRIVKYENDDTQSSGLKFALDFDALLDEIEKMQEALRFYSFEAGYNCPEKGCKAKICVLGDKGQRALDCLNGLTKES